MELPHGQRTVDRKGRELNLAWSKPWQAVHVQMPWLSCQRSTPAEAAVLQDAKAIWGRPGGGGGRVVAGSQQTADTSSSSVGSNAAGAVATGGALRRPPPPLPLRRAAGAAAAAAAAATAAAAAAAASPAAVSTPATSDTASSPAQASCAIAAPLRLPVGEDTPACGALSYAEGPLMLFLDTSALLSMLNCPPGVAAATPFTLRLLCALAGSGRFGRGAHNKFRGAAPLLLLLPPAPDEC